MRDWIEKTFKDPRAIVTWISTLIMKYANILVLADIAIYQYVSTITCERSLQCKI